MINTIEDYEAINDEIRSLIKRLKPHLFLTFKDVRGNGHTGFRTTSPEGYSSRELHAERAMSLLACKLGIHKKGFKWLGIHESGNRAAEGVVRDKGHIHIVARLPQKISGDALTKGIDEFRRALKKQMSWLDVCTTLNNQKDGNLFIQSLEAVMTYCAKNEAGFIDGRKFYKQPFGSALRLN